MMNFLKKSYSFVVIVIIFLISFSAFVLLDTFVIEKSKTNVVNNAIAKENTEDTDTKATVTDTSYKDDNMDILIETKQKAGTTYYVADIKLSDASFLKTALAKNSYGRNIKEKTSAMAKEHNAILALNGDYYGFRDSGYVLRNGISYRDKAGSDEGLMIDKNGNMSVFNEKEKSLNQLEKEDAWQVLSFGPSLLKEGVITVGKNDEIDLAKRSNPRTAIGQIDDLHYIVVVSDGRSSESRGFSLMELAEIMEEEGCYTAYNLDGGGSSSLVFMGKVINKPTTNGKTIKEREVSDIVYFGNE